LIKFIIQKREKKRYKILLIKLIQVKITKPDANPIAIGNGTTFLCFLEGKRTSINDYLVLY